MTNLITKNMMIGELMEKYPNLAEVLTNDYGFHCIGCMGATMETLEEGARVHGLNGKEISKMVTALNQLLTAKTGKK